MNLPKIRRPRWLYLRNDLGRIRLSWLVAIGTFAVVVAGGALFLWFAWLLSRQPSSWAAWLTHVDGQGWFDAAKTTAAILAIVGVGGAALVAYRRQDTAEQTHSLEIGRHNRENERHQDDRERELRSRFTTIAEQLSGKSAVRLAGAYGLAALADDWHRFGNDNERQVCVSLLCAQLRRQPSTEDDPDEDEFRKTVIAIIAQHRPEASTQVDESDWRSCELDLSGADLTNASGLWKRNFTRVILNEAKLKGAFFAISSLAGAQLRSADLREAYLSGADLRRADLSHARLIHAKMINTNLTNAVLAHADLAGADLRGANLTGASLDGIETEQMFYDADTIWPLGFEPPPLYAPPEIGGNEPWG